MKTVKIVYLSLFVASLQIILAVVGSADPIPPGAPLPSANRFLMDQDIPEDPCMREVCNFTDAGHGWQSGFVILRETPNGGAGISNWSDIVLFTNTQPLQSSTGVVIPPQGVGTGMLFRIFFLSDPGEGSAEKPLDGTVTFPGLTGVMQAGTRRDLKLADIPLFSPSFLDELSGGFTPYTATNPDTGKSHSYRIFSDQEPIDKPSNNDSQVPEPSTLFLLGSSLTGLAIAAWRRRRQ